MCTMDFKWMETNLNAHLHFQFGFQLDGTKSNHLFELQLGSNLKELWVNRWYCNLLSFIRSLTSATSALSASAQTFEMQVGSISKEPQQPKQCIESWSPIQRTCFWTKLAELQGSNSKGILGLDADQSLELKVGVQVGGTESEQTFEFQEGSSSKDPQLTKIWIANWSPIRDLHLQLFEIPVGSNPQELQRPASEQTSHCKWILVLRNP